MPITNLLTLHGPWVENVSKMFEVFILVASLSVVYELNILVIIRYSEKLDSG